MVVYIRINRFVAEVLIDGTTEYVHVKNTGRLKELLVPNAKVTLQRAEDANRKTGYDLISVYKPRLKWVNIDSLAPNALMKQQIMSLNYDLVKPEYTYGDSRFDFYMERHGEKYLTEVKGCTLAADLKKGIGLFPDAPTERGVKHLEELTAAAKEGYHCAIAFVIQMNGIHTVFPNDDTQHEFGEVLARAVYAFQSRLNSSYGMDVMYYDHDKNTNVSLYKTQKRGAQRFTGEKKKVNGHTYWLLVKKNSFVGKRGVTENKSKNVIFSPLKHTNWQLFRVYRFNDGSIQFINRATNNAIQVAGGKAASRANVETAKANLEMAQRWYGAIQ